LHSFVIWIGAVGFCTVSWLLWGVEVVFYYVQWVSCLEQV